MKYGIICALEEEISFIRKDMQIAKETKLGVHDYIEGTLYGKECVLVMSLIGKVASATTAVILIDRFKVNNVIFCGVAGGIAPELNTGDVVIGDCLIQHDMFDGINHFKIPRLDVANFIPDKDLSALMFKGVCDYLKKGVYDDIPKEILDEFHISSPRAVLGTIASGDQFICDESKNKWLLDNIENLKCVEMEGAAVAQVCYQFSIPFAVIRVISDCANEESSIAFDKFAEKAMPYFTRGNLKAAFSLI